MRRVLREHSGFVRENARWLSAGFLLMFFSSFGQTFFIGVSGNDLRATYHLSGGAFGALYMTATLASAATLPFLGRTLDLMSGWKVARLAIPFLALARVLITLAPNVVALGITLYLLRLFGQGMMTEIAFTETGRWLTANRGRAMSIITPGVSAGTGVSPVLVVLIDAASGNWHVAWLAAAAVLMLVALPLIPWLMRDQRAPRTLDADTPPPPAAKDWTRAQVLRDPVFYLLLAGLVAPPFIGTTVFFFQGYLTALRGYSELVFAAAFPVMSVTTVAVGFLCGALIDRFGALRLLPFVLMPMTLAALAASLIAQVWGVYVFMLLLGMSNGFTSTLLGALWPEVYGVRNLGGIRAIVVAAMVLATALGPGPSGQLIDLGVDLPRQLLWMAGWCVMASVALTVAARHVTTRAM